MIFGVVSGCVINITMSKARGFSLEQIYSKERPSHADYPRPITDAHQRFVRATFASDPFFKRVLTEFGEPGLKQFIHSIEVKNRREIEVTRPIWTHILDSGHAKTQPGVLRQNSTVSENPQQNQIGSTKRTKGAVLVFSQANYYQLKSRYQVRELAKRIQIMNSLPCFAEIPHAHLKALCTLVNQKRYEKNMTVYRQGSLATSLFIVKEGVFVMNRFSEDRRMDKPVLLLDNFNLFGEESLKSYSKSQAQETYICEVQCRSKTGVLLVINRDMFCKFPLKSNPNLPLNIYTMYTQRRRIAEDKKFEQDTKPIQQSRTTIESGQNKKYYERLLRMKRRNLTKIQTPVTENYSGLEFFKKDQFTSMKLKLKYQNILDKVKTMNTVTLRKIEINGKNGPRSFTRGVDLQKKFFLKSLERKYEHRSSRDHGRDVMNALIIQAAEDLPPHRSEYLRVKSKRFNLHNSMVSDNSTKTPPGTINGGSKHKSSTNVYNFLNKKEPLDVSIGC